MIPYKMIYTINMHTTVYQFWRFVSVCIIIWTNRNRSLCTNIIIYAIILCEDQIARISFIMAPLSLLEQIPSMFRWRRRRGRGRGGRGGGRGGRVRRQDEDKHLCKCILIKIILAPSKKFMLVWSDWVRAMWHPVKPFWSFSPKLW